MKIIISPAKKMRTELDFLEPKNMPVFINQAQQLKEYLQRLSYEELKKLLCCNDQIAALNYERYQNMNLFRLLTPALFAYDGIQYQYMAPQVFETGYYNYVENRLRILSGFYGVLKPFDGVVPYRLEMQAKLKTDFCRNLYDFWGDSLYRELTADGERTILNLASKEYSKTIEKYLDSKVRYVTCIFGEEIAGKIIEKGVYVKMARGEMVRYMAENQIEDIEKPQAFDRLGFGYRPDLSASDRLVFIRTAS